MSFHGYCRIVALGLALALTGCGGMATTRGVPNGASSAVEPPAWNTLEMMILDTEVV